MDDEFKLCWKNFQDNIASGFQNLYDRGDLVDVTLACDGKLLHAHKIVLAICSPYFQEIFTTNPCQHPIIILKDVSYNIMCELLEFMYQGVVNVKHTELQSFMKIGQLLQIKGLATNSTSSPGSSSSEKSTSQAHGAGDDEPHLNSSSHNNNNNSTSSSNNNNSGVVSKTESDHNEPQTSSKAGPPSNLRSSTASPGAGVGGNYSKGASDHQMYTVSKRPTEFGNDSLSIYPRKHRRRSLSDHAGSGGGAGPESNENTDAAMDALNSEEFFLPPIPHISMVESRYDIGGLKRESDHHGSSASSSSASSSAAAAAVASLRNSFPPAFNLDYNFYKPGNTGGAGGGSNNNNNNGNAGVGIGSNPGQEYPNELYMPNDYSKNFGNHMDIPPIAPGEHWFQGKLEFMLSQRGKPLLVHDGHTFGIQYVRKDKKYWQCNLSRKFNCKARVTTTDTGEIIVTNNEHCHTEIRQHLRKDYQRNKVMMNALLNLSANRYADLNLRRHSLVSLAGLAPLSVVPPALSQGSPIEDVVQNLHDFANKSSGPDSSGTANQLQQDRVISSIRHDHDEPLDCGLRSSMALEDVARNFIANKIANNESNNDLTKEEQEWKSKNDSPNVH
ncbi:protein bric-a-brac 2 isoform X2 [Scaptodrosophila lebanonensis]|uniref:Protein bric-a-brac 2 isoform X2 n=1 Tax=Drosophila lebanonensis TaxID=7225 RepID=A0A6J2T7X5_DROLE|nr:protein bric-a-brac 2 isoform X2 [Scaptodrosophila lebanonensis]